MFRGAAALIVVSATLASGVAFAVDGRINSGLPLNDVVGKMLASIKTPTQKDAPAK